MPFAATRTFPKAAASLKTTAMRKMLTGLMRTKMYKRLGFYGALCSLIVLAFTCGGSSQVFAADAERVGFPWDWSHEHLIFGNTNDPELLAIIQQDPRAFHQWLRRNRAAAQQAASDAPISFDTFLQSNFLQSDEALIENPSVEPGLEPQSKPRRAKHIRKRDWGVSLGTTHFNPVNVPNAAPVYPAKYTYDVNALPLCQDNGLPPHTGDYLVFPTGAQGRTSSQASIVIYNHLYSTQPAGGYCNTNGPTVFAAYINAACPATQNNDAILSSPVISLDGTKIAWVTQAGVVQIVTLGAGGGSVAAPLCIGSAGSGGDGASLQTLTLGNALHSPTSGVSVSAIFVNFNADIAYIGDNDGFLHKITPFFGTSGALTETTTPAWLASHAYSLGALVVDTNGFIEKCTTAGTSGSGGHPSWNITWNGTTADNSVTWTNIGSGGGWPVYVTGSSNHTDSSALNGPVLDFVSKNLLVGDQNGSLYYVMDPTSTAVGSCANGQTLYPCLGLPGVATGITTAGGAQMDCSGATASPGGATCLVMSNKQGFTDSVIVDSPDNLVITQFSNADNASAKVEQTNSTLSVFNSVNLANQVNLSSHTGAFDNTYYTTPASGYYYVCGPDTDGHETDLYRVGFTNTLGTIALGAVNGTPLKLTVTGNSGNCSPLTENYNTSTSNDLLFLSLDNQGKFPASNPSLGCSAGSCVLSFILGSSMVTGPQSFYGSGNGGIAGMMGTGGIIVDNEAAASNTPSHSITAASESGTTATITTSTTLGVIVGQNIKVSGMAAGLTGYNATSAGVTCVGASCATGATANSISYTAGAGLSSCSSTATCAGSATGIGFNNASSIYLMPTAANLTCGDGSSNTGCALKLTQAGLQ